MIRSVPVTSLALFAVLLTACTPGATGDANNGDDTAARAPSGDDAGADPAPDTPAAKPAPKPETGKPPVAKPPAPAPQDGAVEPTIEVVKEGSGEVCGTGRAAVMHYIGTFPDGRKFDSSRDRGRPHVFQVGSRQVIEGWDWVAERMQVGDRWKVTIPWQMAYGENGRQPIIPPKTDLVFDMELMDVAEPKVEVLASGSGPTPKQGYLVEVHYTGTLASGGKEFDSSRGKDEGFVTQAGVRAVIMGWDMVLMRMKKGDHWKVTIPWVLGYGEDGSPPDIPPKSDLVFDMELMQIIGPELEVLQKGSGDLVERGQRVKVHYTGTLTDGTEFDSTRKPGGEPFEFTVGVSRVISGWHMTLTQMRPGERVEVKIPWQFAYGPQGRPPQIPGKADLIFDIELLSVE